MHNSWKSLWWSWPVLAVFLSGCFLWPWKGGPKERTVQLTFEAPRNLNYDGESANTIEVAVFILQDTINFSTGQVDALLDPGVDRSFNELFEGDIIKRRTYTIWPDKSETFTIMYTIGPTGPRQVYLGVIGDFFRPPENGRERSVYPLKRKSTQRLRVEMGKNFIQSISKR